MPLVDTHEGVDFEVHDETGKALVRAREKTLPVLVQDARLESGFLRDAGPRLESFLARHGRSSKQWIFNRALTYREGIVEPGEDVAVLGEAHWEIERDEGADRHRGLQPQRRLVLAAPVDQPLFLTDDPAVVSP